MRWIDIWEDGAASERKDGQNGGLGLELSFAGGYILTAPWGASWMSHPEDTGRS